MPVYILSLNELHQGKEKVGNFFEFSEGFKKPGV